MANKKAPWRDAGAGGRITPATVSATASAVPATNPRVFSSATLGTDVNLVSAAKVHSDDLEDLWLEVGAAVSDVNTRIRTSSSEARATGRHLPPHEWAELQTRRSFLAALHQQLQVRIGRQKRLERQERGEAWLRERAEVAHSLEFHFQQVVRQEASPVDYQRWVLQAEVRRAAAVRHEQAAQRRQAQQQGGQSHA